jgi:hypothetical protein
MVSTKGNSDRGPTFNHQVIDMEKPPTPLDSTVLGVAILEFADLAVRYLSADARGRTPLAVKDEEVLRHIVDRLITHRHALDVPGTAKVAKLTPDQEALGWARRALNDLCTYATGEGVWSVEREEERDQILAKNLLMPFLNSRLPVNAGMIDKAIEKVRTAAKIPIKGQENYDRDIERENASAGPLLGQDTYRIPADWVAGGKPREGKPRNRKTPSGTMPDPGELTGWPGPALTAGKLLHEIVEQLPCKPDVSSSNSSTAEYAEKVLAQLRAKSLRSVTPLQRLAYLMTVLGVPLEDAPWTSLLVSKLLVGESVLGRPFSDSYSTQVVPPNPPAAFRVLDTEHKKPIMEKVRQALIDAGFPEDRLSTDDPNIGMISNVPWEVVDSFMADPTHWAGTTVPPQKEEKRLGTWPNPWREAYREQRSSSKLPTVEAYNGREEVRLLVAREEEEDK